MSEILKVTLGMTNNFLKNRHLPTSPLVGNLLNLDAIKGGRLNTNYYRNLISGFEVSGNKKGFWGFFNAPVDPFAVKKPYQDDLIRINEQGQVRLNPGIPIMNPDFYGTSYYPFQPYKPSTLSMDYLIHKMYNTAFILQNVPNVSDNIRQKYSNELNMLARNLQRMYPFDYKGIPAIQRSLNHAFSNKVSSGGKIADNLFDVIREADRYRNIYLPATPFQHQPYKW